METPSGQPFRSRVVHINFPNFNFPTHPRTPKALKRNEKQFSPRKRVNPTGEIPFVIRWYQSAWCCVYYNSPIPKLIN